MKTKTELADAVGAITSTTRCQPRRGAIYRSLGKVMDGMKELAKTEQNAAQGWSYRGIDGLMNQAHGIMSKAGLVVLPHVLSEPLIELGPVSKKGTQYYRSLVKMSFEFLSTQDGSSVVSGAFIGEGIDTSDKATNKAQTAAYKWCFFQTFCIPVKGGLADSEEATEIDEDEAREKTGKKLADSLADAFSKIGATTPPPSQKSTTEQPRKPQTQQKDATKDGEHRDELNNILIEITGGIEALESDILKKWSIFTNGKGEEIWARDTAKLSGRWLGMILDKAKADLKDMQELAKTKDHTQDISL